MSDLTSPEFQSMLPPGSLPLGEPGTFGGVTDPGALGGPGPVYAPPSPYTYPTPGTVGDGLADVAFGNTGYGNGGLGFDGIGPANVQPGGSAAPMTSDGATGVVGDRGLGESLVPFGEQGLWRGGDRGLGPARVLPTVGGMSTTAYRVFAGLFGTLTDPTLPTRVASSAASLVGGDPSASFSTMYWVASAAVSSMLNFALTTELPVLAYVMQQQEPLMPPQAPPVDPNTFTTAAQMDAYIANLDLTIQQLTRMIAQQAAIRRAMTFEAQRRAAAAAGNAAAEKAARDNRDLWAATYNRELALKGGLTGAGLIAALAGTKGTISTAMGFILAGLLQWLAANSTTQVGKTNADVVVDMIIDEMTKGTLVYLEKLTDDALAAAVAGAQAAEASLAASLAKAQAAKAAAQAAKAAKGW